MGRPPSERAAGAWVPVLGYVGCSAGRTCWLTELKLPFGEQAGICVIVCREVLPKWVMLCGSLTRPGAVFSGIWSLPSGVMNQPFEFSLAHFMGLFSLLWAVLWLDWEDREGEAYFGWKSIFLLYFF
jgi:hypothetical protein